MSKLERLMKLLAVLLDTEMPISADSLRQRIGGYPDHDASFRRAFERDKDDLRSMGVNILVSSVPETEPPLDGYIVDADSYAGQDPGLAPDELAALHLAAALVRVDSLGDDAFWKLGGSSLANESDVAAVTVPSAERAGRFHTAITERRVATFDYRGNERILEPGRVSFVHGNWYVSGHDRTREAERVFRIDRIGGDIVLGDAGEYEPRPARGPEVVRTWEFGDDEPVDAVVRIDGSASQWVKVHLDPSEFDERPDGAIDVRLSVRNVDAFRDWVLTFVDAATVISPPSYRTMMLEWLDALVGGR